MKAESAVRESIYYILRSSANVFSLRRLHFPHYFLSDNLANKRIGIAPTQDVLHRLHQPAQVRVYRLLVSLDYFRLIAH